MRRAASCAAIAVNISLVTNLETGTMYLHVIDYEQLNITHHIYGYNSSTITTMRKEFKNSCLTLTAYVVVNDPKKICIVLSVHSEVMTEISKTGIYTRDRIPIASFCRLERDCVAFYRSISSIDYDKYAKYGESENATYDDSLQYWLNIRGTDRKRRRKTSKETGYKRLTANGPNNSFQISLIRSTTQGIDAMKEMVVTNLARIVRDAFDVPKSLVRTSYDRLNASDLLEAYRRKERANASFQHALDVTLYAIQSIVPE